MTPTQLTLPGLLNHLGSLLLSLKQRLDSLRVGSLVCKRLVSPHLHSMPTMVRDCEECGQSCDEHGIEML